MITNTAYKEEEKRKTKHAACTTTAKTLCHTPTRSQAHDNHHENPREGNPHIALSYDKAYTSGIIT